MWCIEAKAKIDIPLGSQENDYENCGNARLVQYIISHRGACREFDEALKWVGDRSYTQAVKDCTKPSWVRWLKGKLTNTKFELIKEGANNHIDKRKEREVLLCGPEVGYLIYQKNMLVKLCV